MKKYNKFLELLFKTKNLSKILKAYNSLSMIEKQTVLNNEKVIQRIAKISDIYFLLSLTSNLPSEIRINFLNNLDTQKFTKDYELFIINFLKISDYEQFDYQQLNILANITDTSILELLFRQLSVSQLESIIIANISSNISDTAFVEYSKKSVSLDLKANLIENVNTIILTNELKRRNHNPRSNITIDISEFQSLSADKQSSVLNNCYIPNIRDSLIYDWQEEITMKSEEEIKELFLKNSKDIVSINILRLQTIIANVGDSLAFKLINLFIQNLDKFEFPLLDKYIYAIIYKFRQLQSTTKELTKALKLDPFNFVYYLNTGILSDKSFNYLTKVITFDQYQKTNFKKINNLIKLLRALDDKSKIKLDVLAYKLYYVLGYENSIELLNHKFGHITLTVVNDLFSSTKIDTVNLINNNGNYEPEIKMDFIQFLIGNKKDKNTTLKRVLRKELDIIYDNFANIYSYLERYQNVIGNKIHLNNLIPLLEDNQYFLLPSEYKFTTKLIDDIIKSYKYTDVIGEVKNDCSTNEIVHQAVCFYHDYLEKRTICSIPRVFGITSDNYSYEVLKLNDPSILTIGYKTKCCFRLNGGSKEFLKYCSSSPYARVIVIRNELNEICSMTPIVRNGNIINGNSIESKNSLGNDEYIFKALKMAMEDIINLSQKYEENPITIGSVTNLHNNIPKDNKKIVAQPIYPIRNNNFYTNYGNPTYLIAGDDNIQNIKLYQPEAIYYDERPAILINYPDQNDEYIIQEINNRIACVDYILKKENINRYAIYTVCSEDWYLTVSYYGIDGEYLSTDPRAREEYEAVKAYLENRFLNTPLYNMQLTEAEINGKQYDTMLSRQRCLKQIDN